MYRFVLFLVFCAFVSFSLVSCQAEEETYDVVIKDGRVVDGSGSPYFKADIGIVDGTIERIGYIDEESADNVIDAEGLVVAPGFIDLHSHAASGMSDPELSQARPLIAQGITTIFLNPDAGEAVDLAEQREELLEHGLGVNAAQFIGHGSVRREVMGMEERVPDEEEMEEMKGLVETAMEEGAFGLSSGLYYAPGSYAETEEVIELANVASEYGGFYSSHIRDESNYSVGVIAAVEEVIEIAEAADMPGNVTHIKVLGPTVWGQSEEVISLINDARERGVEIWADQYPYTSSGSSITGALVPRWALEGGDEALVERIEDPDVRPRLQEEMKENMEVRRGGADRLQIRRYEPEPELEGMTLAEIAEEQDTSPVDLAMEMLKEGGASFVSHVMQDEDVENFMSQPWTAIASDGGLVPMGEGVPHPRNYGTYPRLFSTFVKERGVVSLEDAVRKSSSLPARIARIEDRGILQKGGHADIAVFNYDEIQDNAEYLDPHQLSEGMVHVLVNGVPVLEDGEFTGQLPGRVLRRN